MSIGLWQGIRMAVAGWKVCVKAKEWNAKRKAAKAAKADEVQAND